MERHTGWSSFGETGRCETVSSICEHNGTTKYAKEQQKKYTNYTVWDYEPSEFSSGGGKKSKPVDDEDYISEEDVPF